MSAAKRNTKDNPFMSTKKLHEHLTAWLRENPSSEYLQIDGNTNPVSNPEGWIYFNFSPSKTNAQHDEFRGLYQLAGDTQKQAAERFVKLFEEHKDSPEGIFEYTRSAGGRRRQKLALRGEGVGWQCLKVQR